MAISPCDPERKIMQPFKLQSVVPGLIFYIILLNDFVISKLLFESIPTKFDAFKDHQLDINCHTDPEIPWSGNVMLIQIGKRGQDPIVDFDESSKILMTSLSTHNMKADGRISKDRGNSSYLQLTITNPDSSNAGSYFCRIFYVERQDGLRNETAYLYVDVDNQEMKFIVDGLREKMSRLHNDLNKQNVIISKQQKQQEILKEKTLRRTEKLQAQNGTITQLIDKIQNQASILKQQNISLHSQEINDGKLQVSYIGMKEFITAVLVNFTQTLGDEKSERKEQYNTLMQQNKKTQIQYHKLSIEQNKTRSEMNNLRNQNQNLKTMYQYLYHNQIKETTKQYDILNKLRAQFEFRLNLLHLKVQEQYNRMENQTSQTQIHHDRMIKQSKDIREQFDDFKSQILTDMSRQIDKWKVHGETIEKTANQLDRQNKQLRAQSNRLKENTDKLETQDRELVLLKKQDKYMKEDSNRINNTVSMLYKTVIGIGRQMRKEKNRVGNLAKIVQEPKDKVAFSVGYSYHGTGSPLFTKAITNIGGGFNTTSGRFVVPGDGVYAFYLMMGTAEGILEAAIISKGTPVARLFIPNGSPHRQSSSSAVVTLKTGDIVQPSLDINVQLDKVYPSPYSVFMGYRI